MKKLTISALLTMLLCHAATADNLHFAYRPSLSPDGKNIYFSYQGDIYSVPSTGGEARAIVNLGGTESFPIVSPDGKYLAFSSDIMGNTDVYIVPAGGGEAKQLTFHDGADTPYSWSADSKYIYFESTRGSARKTTYRVAVKGGTPELMFSGFFNTIVNLVENPKTGEFLFNESMESISFPTRKRYIGDHNPNIKSWNPKTSEYKELTDYEGKDTWPMVDKNGNLYYISDALNKESNIVKYNTSGKPQQLTSFDSSVQYPKISADGSTIVFMKDYEINCLDLASGKVNVPQISISNSGVEVHRLFSDQKPSAAAVSPDGKKLALVIRGQLYISDIEGKYLKLMNTPSNERVSELVWSNSLTVYYSRTDKGWTNIFKIEADGSSPEERVFTSRNNSMNLTLSNDLEMLAFIDGSHDVMIHNIKKGTTEKIAEAEFWSFEGYDLSFSPDDKYLAFDAMHKFESDIFLYSFKDKSLVNMTHSASVEGGMVFSPDRKYMYLLANPRSASFPKGSSVSLYKLPLQKYNDKPFKSDIYDSLFDDKYSEKKFQKIDETKIDLNDIHKRLEQVEKSGRQSGLFTFSSNNKSYLLYSSYGGNGSGVYSLEISDPEAKPKQIKDVKSGSFFKSKNDLYLLSSGSIYKIDPAAGSSKKIEISKDVDKVLSDEFEQMFYEVWAVLEQNFYDVNMHGVDWKAVRDRYAAMLPYVKTRDNLRTLITDMQGELNSSHQGFTTSGKEEKYETNMHSISTGIVYDNANPYMVDHILAYSPADKVDVNINKGDVLVAVNGKRIDHSQNREKYFSSPVSEDEVILSFSRKGKEFDVKLHCCSSSEYKSLSYREWEEERKEIVENNTSGRVAYIHMQAMGNEDLDNFLLNMHTYADDKDALILDLRYNNGGNVHNEVIEFLTQKRYFDWSYRDFPTTTHPNVTPAGKPIVVLVNEHSLSDAEVTSNGIKTLGIAKLVGTETYRWIIFTSSVRLLDGSTCRMPAWGCYNLNGEDLENVGVKPDIYVKNTFKDRLDNKDPQLDAAIKEIMSQLNNK